jgi:hypothetical protein
MLERPGNLSAQASAHIAILGAAVSMLMIAAGAAWPQTRSPAPSLGIQEPAQNTVPQPAPSPSPPEPEENPGLFNEIGRMFDKLPTLKATQETIEDLNARAKGAARDASESLSHLAKPSSMVSGQHRFRGNLLGESVDPRPHAKTGRLPDRQFCHQRAVPVISRSTKCRASLSLSAIALLV